MAEVVATLSRVRLLVEVCKLLETAMYDDLPLATDTMACDCGYIMQNTHTTLRCPRTCSNGDDAKVRAGDEDFMTWVNTLVNTASSQMNGDGGGPTKFYKGSLKKLLVIAYCTFSFTARVVLIDYN